MPNQTSDISYLEKLKDPRWQKLRLKILERDEWTCQKCLNSEATLHVHHRYYLKDTDPWDYPEEALVTLCEECHQYEKDNMQEGINKLIKTLKEYFLSDDIANISEGFWFLKLNHLPEVVASAIGWWLMHENNTTFLIDTYLEHLEGVAKKREKCVKSTT